MGRNTEYIVKDIPGFPNYKITNIGYVLSKRKGWRPLLPSTTLGYHQIHLYDKGNQKMKMTHRLVAEAFIPNPQDFKTVDHADCDKSNNNVSNLSWMSLVDNIHRYKKNNLPIGVQQKSGGFLAMRSVNCIVHFSRKLPTVEAAEYWYKSFGINRK